MSDAETDISSNFVKISSHLRKLYAEKDADINVINLKQTQHSKLYVTLIMMT